MPRGGKREGAGRKPGQMDEASKEVHEYFNTQKLSLFKLAVKKAFGGNDKMLMKLIDKMMPTNNVFSIIPDNTQSSKQIYDKELMETLIIKFSKYYADKKTSKKQ